MSMFDFFYNNAGYSYDPETETEEEGRVRCAKALEKAWNRFMGDRGLVVNWYVDPDVRSSEWDDESDYETWVASIEDSDGRILEAMGGIDLGEDGHPDSTTDNYPTVIEAEMALRYYGYENEA